MGGGREWERGGRAGERERNAKAAGALGSSVPLSPTFPFSLSLPSASDKLSASL